MNENVSPPQNAQSDQVAAPVIRSVFVSQVITEPELVNQSALLEQALEYGNFTGVLSLFIDQIFSLMV